MKNPDSYKDPDLKRLKSQEKAESARDARTDNVKLRVPKGMKEQIQQYVATLPDYVRMRNGVPVPNVNQWIVDTLNDALPDEYKADIM